jgi:hypothetical protein
MMELGRDIFPAHVLQRMQTPIQRKNAISNLAVSRQRPWGGILQPVSTTPASVDQQGKTQ